MGTAGAGGRELAGAPGRGRRSRRLSVDRESPLPWRAPGDAASSNLRHHGRHRPRGATSFHGWRVSLSRGPPFPRPAAPFWRLHVHGSIIGVRRSSSHGVRRSPSGVKPRVNRSRGGLFPWAGIPWIHDRVRRARTARPRGLPREGCGLHRRRTGPPGRGPSRRTSDGDGRRLRNGPRTAIRSHSPARRRRWASRATLSGASSRVSSIQTASGTAGAASHSVCASSRSGSCMRRWACRHSASIAGCRQRPESASARLPPKRRVAAR